MTRFDGEYPEEMTETPLPRRDWILLPLLSLVTILLMIVSAQSLAKRIYKESAPFLATCLGPSDPKFGAFAIPNSVCSDKKFESQRAEYKFNSCGHRAGMECGPKPPGTYRIVMDGSSFAMGALIQREKTFAALLPGDLSSRTHRKVELYNEGLLSVYPPILALRFHEVLAAQPDMILWIITPYDIYRESAPEKVEGHFEANNILARAKSRLGVTLTSKPFPEAMQDLLVRLSIRFDDTALGTMCHHVMNESKSLFVKSRLLDVDPEGYLKSYPSAEWRSRLQSFDGDAANIEAQAKAAGIPLVAVLVPTRVEAAMASMPGWPPGYDPFKLDEELRSIIVRHGGIYIDILPDIRDTVDPERGYFIVDGHPNVEGHAMISSFLAKELTSGAVPGLSSMAPLQSSEEQQK